ncbi:hypothetical protein [Desulforhopalus sp. 52FAK]
MILHPGIIGLIIGAVITLLMVSYATITGWQILVKWDFSSSSEYQLKLERKTYLVATLVNWALGFQIVSTILFVYTMDDIHGLFVGAMCATGSLNANPVGWYALLIKIVTLFISAFWVSLNMVDQSLEDYPFVRLKYILLLVVAPMIAADLGLQLEYFMGLEPAIITSCCGSLFGSESVGTIASLSAFPVGTSMAVFYGTAAVYLCVTCALLHSNSSFLRYLTTLVGGLFFCIVLASIISFVSIYIYELPTHHCPFDILQGWYNYIGYPIYILLFLSVYFGMLPGLFRGLRRYADSEVVIIKFEKGWVYWSIGSTLSLLVLITYAVLSSNLQYYTG